jgi:SAM-dependent methyltransferase
MAIKIITPGDESAIEKHARWVAQQGFRRVLDVGGLERPLRPATHVLDLYPYERRRVDEGRGSLPERFNAETWKVYDVNNVPWPYPDDFFDYVWCCQVVEDVRDPVAVCREMQRVGRAGFVSTVHRSYESSVVQGDGVVGYHHHRWLVEADQDNGVAFTFKSPILQVTHALRPVRYIQWLLHWTWENCFDVEETFTGGDLGQRAELAEYLRRFEHG